MGKPGISDPFAAGTTEVRCYGLFMPIRKDGKAIGICFAFPLFHAQRTP
ncbi:hypothetical protein WCP94_000522 (plasmid) [Bilophila wadsworthia]